MQGLQNVCRCDVLAADLEGVKLDIVIMQNKLKASEALNESLKEIIMCMNSERVHKSMHMKNTSGITKPESGDQSRLNQPDNYNYNGPKVNDFDPVLENEIKDNANAIRLSEMDNEPSRNSQKGLNHQNMKLMQKTVLKQGHNPSIAKGQPRNCIRNNAKAENLQLGEKQSKPNEIKDTANAI
ncbi:Hypothetical predicted protein [Paramuricea clavata]|uniref:Uncharacterized protein n=1 Tax=Paramuricea clavata TaxID=317549 RepID=A0A6S7IW43_PARCT|nr:Hypothetical predicted protein [Paramuricea clavata]